MNFEEALEYLLRLGHETLAIKLGLRNTELLLQKLDNPHKTFDAVQIAGTNGKGSTAVVLDSICRQAGILTGLYTSPHLVSITERIEIDGSEISEEEFARLATKVRTAAEELLQSGEIGALPTFFEHVTAIALLAFKDAGVRLAILETGLGGRLDATTVAGAQTVAITPVALDHQEYLGDTLEEIAAEKAAIIRPGVTAIVARQSPEALAVILKRSKECGVQPEVKMSSTFNEASTDDGRFRLTFKTRHGIYENVLLGVRGRHQIINVETAIRLAESLRDRGFPISDSAIVQGIESALHPGRLELMEGSPSILLDGAHNPSGARALTRYLSEFVHVPITMVFGAMSDKRLDEIAAELFPFATRLVLTRPDNPRAASVSKLKELASTSLEAQDVYSSSSVSDALNRAKKATPVDGMIVITGSLYLIGEAKRLLP